MIDTVAKAICNDLAAVAGSPGWVLLDEPTRDVYRHAAQAAMVAMGLTEQTQESYDGTLTWWSTEPTWVEHRA